MERTTFAALALAVGLAVQVLSPAAAKVLLAPEEALALAFPGCAIHRETVYLTTAEVTSARELAGTELASAVVHPYRAWREEGTGAAA